MGVFNIVMRIVSSFIGLAMVAMGTVWILQAQIVWSNTRQLPVTGR